MELSVEEELQLKTEIERIANIQDKSQQQYEFCKFFHSSFLWKKAVNEVFNSYVVEVKPLQL